MWLVLATATGQIQQRTPQIIFLFSYIGYPYNNAVGKAIMIVFMSSFFLFSLLFDLICDLGIQNLHWYLPFGLSAFALQEVG